MATSLTPGAHEFKVMAQIVPVVSPEAVQCPTERKDNKTKVPEVPYMTKMFLKGEPVALGTVQMLIGIVMIAVGAVTWFTQTLHGEIPVCLGVSFIFSGSVTLSAHKGTCPPMIKSTVALNIISALLAMSGICYFCFALSVNLNLNPFTTERYDCYPYFNCSFAVDTLQTLLNGVKGILLVLSVLEVCVCMTTVVFSCKANMQDSGKNLAVLEIEEYSSQEALINREVAEPPVYEP